MSLITDIQKYSVHDGEGIRTTVFFKGCALKCLWCHNPETQSAGKELLSDMSRCTGCGACARVCPSDAVTVSGGVCVTDRSKCTVCGQCIDVCNLNLREIAGREYTVDALVKELLKDEMFYEESGGGVTLSGGEVMLSDMDFLETVLKKLKRKGIHVAVDTCGFAPVQNYRRIFPYVDTFLYDLKIPDSETHRKYTGAGNETILANLEEISRLGADIWIRIPVIAEVNGNVGAMEEILKYLAEKEIRVSQVNLLPYHKTGSSKYEKLGKRYEGEFLHAPSDEEMEMLAAVFRKAGYKIKIGG